MTEALITTAGMVEAPSSSDDTTDDGSVPRTIGPIELDRVETADSPTAAREGPATREGDVIRPWIPVPARAPRPEPGTHFLVLEKWEGDVITVGADSFTARMTSLLMDEPRADLEVDIPVDEVDPEDRELISEGAVFYFSVGYEIERSGRRARKSVLRFRRLPGWTTAELDAIKTRGESLRKRLGWARQVPDTAGTE